MSFLVTKLTKEQKSYPEFGTAGSVSEVKAIIEYSAKQLVSLDQSGNAQVLFEVKLDGVDLPGTYYHMFKYSGTGNPLEEAEQSLKAELAE